MAVKLFDPRVVPDDVLLEARRQRRLSQHERIVSLRNVDARAGSGPIAVTDYVPAGSIEDLLQHRTATLPEAVRWTLDALDALVHANGHNVLHRDVKPSNLLLNDAGHAMLTDFGIAEDSFASAGGGQVYPYPQLEAPEWHARGSSEQTEVWAVGCLLHRLLTGDYPFADADDARHRPLVDPHQLNRQIPWSLVWVIRRALAKDPADRYSTVEEMRDALLPVAVVNGFEREARPGTVEAWRAATAQGEIHIEVRARCSDWEVTMRLDKGAGPRRRRRDRLPSEAKALQRCRTWLVEIIEGRGP